jgi:hypothetical protein
MQRTVPVITFEGKTNRGVPFELEAELAKEIDGLSEVIDDDSYVVHPF